MKVKLLSGIQEKLCQVWKKNSCQVCKKNSVRYARKTLSGMQEKICWERYHMYGYARKDLIACSLTWLCTTGSQPMWLKCWKAAGAWISSLVSFFFCFFFAVKHTSSTADSLLSGPLPASSILSGRKQYHSCIPQCCRTTLVKLWLERKFKV